MFAIARQCLFQFGLRNRATNVADLTLMFAGLRRRRNDLLLRRWVGNSGKSSGVWSAMDRYIHHQTNELPSLIKLSSHIFDNNISSYHASCVSCLFRKKRQTTRFKLPSVFLCWFIPVCENSEQIMHLPLFGVRSTGESFIFSVAQPAGSCIDDISPLSSEIRCLESGKQ